MKKTQRPTEASSTPHIRPSSVADGVRITTATARSASSLANANLMAANKAASEGDAMKTRERNDMTAKTHTDHDMRDGLMGEDNADDRATTLRAYLAF